ncbi:hypothetical protein BKA83DRAFT_4464938 [Pisolithus microcarpus]|nr:hypothetical protein BKA83DRAFT_4464938 [Pisolithus microcarpus]
MSEEFAHPKFWTVGVGRNRYQWSCLACKDDKWRDARAARRHEKTTQHQENIGYLLSPRHCPSSSPTRPDVTSPSLNLLTDLLTSTHGPQCPPEAAPPSDNHDQFQLDWDAINHDELYLPSVHEERLTTMASSLAAWLADGQDSSDESGSDPPDVQDEDLEPGIRLITIGDYLEPLQPGAQRPSQRGFAPSSPTWFPWPDKQTCILDVLRHLPRSLFSDSQLQVILWALSISGVDSVPSTRLLKDIDSSLQSQYGIPTVRYEGALGHIYYVNHLPSIIAQEMANPHIRPHIRHYPEDAAGRLDQPWQASRWLYEIEPTVTTPMIRKGRQDFYIFELTKLTDGTMVVPERWYTKPAARNSSPFDLEYWAHAWRAQAVITGGTSGYVIHTHDIVEVPATDLLLSFPQLLQTYRSDVQPDPRNIIETRGHGILPWTLTDPTDGNEWRLRARGHRVLTYMIWLYCDDTSGNMSKKWNKHNSFLFTAAGLPRVMVHKESSIHFLATSNIAPPLEMLDGIVDQLEHAQTHGIWAWDVEAREMVLVIPAVLAMLGDNPMQSELACHVGLQGKFFCRNCWVQGAGVESGQPPDLTGRAVQTNLDDDTRSIETGSLASDSDGSLHQDITRPSKGKGRRSETMQDLVDRARRFLGANTPRTRQDTITKLRSMFYEVTSGKGKTRYTKMKTDTGIKDTYMDVFVERILKRVKGIRAGTERFTDAVSAITQGRPVDQFMSPVWRIKGLDPHQDTPVEVLHVILLGFVKYFWRDAISRLNDAQKAELQVRLSSFNVSGLGIPPLAGQTLVQYAGSLTGRDFRAISQAAPFVLYDLVPLECFEAFLALSSLVPIVWQPCIANIDEHLAAIDYFLNCTARWTPRWFNKPKFHIIRHLPDHIRRFGPAILFATEGFESYNAVIRDHSIHSNRQAPSRDIAHGMARCHRIRHLLSGGTFSARGHVTTELPYSDDEHGWLVPGPGVKSLFSINTPSIRNVVADFFGLADDMVTSEAGSCVHDKTRPRTLEKTSTAMRVPHALRHIECRLYQSCQSVVASSGDICRLGDFVLAQDPCAARGALPLIGCIHEILQICHSRAQQQNQANWLLLEAFQVTGSADVYHLPRLQASGWVVVPANALICCINVQHNCAGHQCTGSSTVSVYEEREKTTKTARRIEHREPADLILNTAQMHNAIYVQQFRTQVQQIQRDWAIHTGAAAELNAQKIKQQKSSRTNPAPRRQSSTNPSVSLSSRFINCLVVNPISATTLRTSPVQGLFFCFYYSCDPIIHSYVAASFKP